MPKKIYLIAYRLKDEPVRIKDAIEASSIQEAMLKFLTTPAEGKTEEDLKEWFRKVEDVFVKFWCRIYE